MIRIMCHPISNMDDGHTFSTCHPGIILAKIEHPDIIVPYFLGSIILSHCLET